jgi:hypothetical protein
MPWSLTILFKGCKKALICGTWLRKRGRLPGRGFANTAIGSAGLGSLFLDDWMLPLAIIGAIFYGLAGINHMTHRRRTTPENIAMTSDLFAAAVLVTACLVMNPKS